MQGQDNLIVGLLRSSEPLDGDSAIAMSPTP
jgi:hypothetical protein